MGWLDRGFLQIVDWIDAVWPDWTLLLAFPAFVLALGMAGSLVVRRLLPIAGSAVVAPVLVTLGGLLGGIALAVQVILTVPWRAFRARPPDALYGLGDITVAGLLRLRTVRRAVIVPFRRVSGVRTRYLLVLLIVLVWRWDSGFCDRRDAEVSPCQSPYGFTLDAAGERWTEFWKYTQSTNARG